MCKRPQAIPEDLQTVQHQWKLTEKTKVGKAKKGKNKGRSFSGSEWLSSWACAEDVDVEDRTKEKEKVNLKERQKGRKAVETKARVRKVAGEK